MLSHTEENYLKGLFHLTHETKEKSDAGTNELAALLDVKPATVNSMLKKLREKELIIYEKYGKITLTDLGKEAALEVIRKHRLWETFLFEKLHFSWDEIHEIAEQLEHIKSEKLTDRLDKFLGYPKLDPHGDPIPDKEGRLEIPYHKTLAELPENSECELVAVKDNSPEFLQYVDKIGLTLNSKIKIIELQDFDGSVTIRTDDKETTISKKLAEHLYVE